MGVSSACAIPFTCDACSRSICRRIPELCLRAASGTLGGSPNFDLIRVRFAHPPSPAQGTQAFLRKARWLDICRMHPLRPQRKLRVWNEPSPMQGTQSCLRHDRWDVLTIHRPKRSGELSKHRMRSKFPCVPEAETKRHPPCRSVRGNPASAPVCAPFKKQSEGVSQ